MKEKKGILKLEITGENEFQFRNSLNSFNEKIKSHTCKPTNKKKAKTKVSESPVGTKSAKSAGINSDGHGLSKIFIRFSELLKEIKSKSINISSERIILELLKYDIIDLNKEFRSEYFFLKDKISDNQIMLKHADSKILVETKNIICLKSYLNDTDFFLIEKEKMFNKDRIQTGININTWKDFLSENGYELFIQIHRSSIVNMENQVGYKSSEIYLIKEIEYRVEEYLDDNTKIEKHIIRTKKLPVTEKFKKSVLNYFENFPTPK